MKDRKLPVSTDSPFFATRELKGVLNNVGACLFTRDLLEFFWGWPIREVREACIKELRVRHDDLRSGGLCENDEDKSLTEKTIRAMHFESEAWDEPTDQLLVWYLSAASKWNMRPIEFALALIKDIKPGWARYPRVHGTVYGAIKRNPKWYWAPSVPEFLEASLAHENWTIVERALELICRAEDTSFLPLVTELSRKAGEEKEKKEDFKTKASDERFASAKARGVLSEAVLHLLICKTEQNEDVNEFKIEVARAIRTAGKLNYLPRVEFFDIHIRYTNDLHLFAEAPDGSGDNIGELLEKKCVLWLTAEGAQIEMKGGAEPGYSHGKEWSIPFLLHLGHGSKAIANIAFGARKTVRLTLEFGYINDKGEWQESDAKLVRYITRAE